MFRYDNKKAYATKGLDEDDIDAVESKYGKHLKS